MSTIRPVRFLATLLTLLLPACGPEPTELKDYLLNIGIPWRLDVELVADGEEVHCRVDDAILELEHPSVRLTAVTGRILGGTLTCEARDDTGSEDFPPLTMRSGRQQPGGRVTLHMTDGRTDLVLNGQLGTQRMSGTVSGELEVDMMELGVLPVVGSFEAEPTRGG